ncbi:hypothetical protein PR202_gb13436 [Eleusine coracana subsp. coracana]|uniref:Uncharacterized protein n=1 Tax=Eleusine coracana subsp. coracana TaxID=191504 RepID=A0AAV5ETT3_ELECO|nr:hypothetical protein PR202_gb13436 [Eleusine coracana subsp. coracana]
MSSSHLPDLSILTIAVRGLQQKDLEILGRLPSLRRLDLEVDHDDLGIVGRFFIGPGFFPFLVRCGLFGFAIPVVFQHGAMPRLKAFEFEFSVREANEIVCSDSGFYMGLGNLQSLKRVKAAWLLYRDTSEQEVAEAKAAPHHFCAQSSSSKPGHISGAMELATGALGTLLPKLAQLLHGEYQLQKNVRKNIEFLTKELETTQAALRVIGEVPTEQVNELVRIWARDARELSYDMEDVVDTFLVRVDGPDPPSKRSSKRFIQKMRSMLAIGKRHEIGEQIEDIKERVVELAARRDRCKVDTVNNYHITSVDPRIKALYVKTTELVGIEKARKEIILELTKGDDKSSQVQKIVSIVGFGGLGKTTLAKAVYDEIESRFDCTAFVTVSRNPDIKKFLKDMLYELDKGKYGNIHSTSLDVNHLIDLVRGFISNKR